MVMQRATHPSPLAIIRDHVEAWRRENRWSRETLADEIVQAHERLGAVDFTRIKFEPKTTDTFERMRVNADRLFRWLDDETKDKNLLSVNMIWSVLAAMPLDRRVMLLNDLLRPVDITVHSAEATETLPTAVAINAHFCGVVEHGALATIAMSTLLDGVDPGEAEHAEKQLGLLATTTQRALSLIARLRKKP